MTERLVSLMRTVRTVGGPDGTHLLHISHIKLDTPLHLDVSVFRPIWNLVSALLASAQQLHWEDPRSDFDKHVARFRGQRDSQPSRKKERPLLDHRFQMSACVIVLLCWPWLDPLRVCLKWVWGMCNVVEALMPNMRRELTCFWIIPHAAVAECSVITQRDIFSGTWWE